MSAFAEYGPVQRDADFYRVFSLPRRVWTDEQLRAAIDHMTPQFLNERGLAEYRAAQLLPTAQRAARLTELKIELLPLQAMALVEAFLVRGLFGALNVGRGKTLITWLLPLLFPHVKVSALFLPGGLKGKDNKLGKTEIEFKRLQTYWKTPENPVRIIGYEFLARKERVNYLCDCPRCTGKPGPDPGGGLRPKIVILDESQKAKNKGAGITKRILRYCSNHADEVMVFAFSGTAIKKSLADAIHLLIIALKLKAPVPFDKHSQAAWCGAYDENPKDGIRRPPGALLEFAGGDFETSFDDTKLERARDAVFKRLSETPGVIMDTEQSCDLPIYIRILKPPDDPILEKAFEYFRETKMTPDGLDVSGPLDLARHGMTLNTGFYNKPDPPPPEWWKEARRACFKVIRKTIEQSERMGRPIETAAQAFDFAYNHPDVQRWLEIERMPNGYKYKTVPVWITTSVLSYVQAWINANSPALIWVNDIPVGEALETLTGLHYYGAGGRNRNKQLIDEADPRKSAIVSIKANMVGRNLHGWNRALAVTPALDIDEWEQGILGRMHRNGQLNPVHLDVLISSADSLYALDRACAKSRFVESARKLRYKLLMAAFDWTYFPVQAILELLDDDPRRPRWQRIKVENALTSLT